jgi:hypothetical protein
VPSSASTLIAATTLAVRASRSASARTSAPIAPIICVPLRSARPSFGLERRGLEAGLAQGDRAPARPAAELDLARADERQREVGERREVARGADAALLRHDRVDAQAEESSSRSTTSGRQPLWPSARVLARSRSIARTTSRGSGGPTPAAWLISRFSWRRPASAGGIDRRGQAPKPVVTP